MGFAKYDLRIDWRAREDGAAFADYAPVPGGGSASQYYGTTSAFPNRIVAAQADASDITVGMMVGLFEHGTNRILSAPHTVTTVSAPAFGFVNIDVFPAFAVTPDGSPPMTIRQIVASGNAVGKRQSATSLTATYGRDEARALGAMKPGTLTFDLDNLSGDYSPEKTTGPLYGLLGPARPCRLTCTVDGTVYTLFTGRTDDFTPTYGPRPEVAISATDALGLLAGAKVSTELYRGIRTGEALHKLLDAVGFTGGRDIDAGATIIPYFWLDSDDALTEVKRLVESEGVPSFVAADENGNIVFRDRHHRLMRPASRTVQSTWRASGAEPRFSTPLEYEHGWKEVLNSVSFDAQVRAAGELAEVWRADSGFTVAAGQTVEIVAKSSDPFYGAVTPTVGPYKFVTDDSGLPQEVAVTDLVLRNGSVSVELSRRSGQSTTIRVTATGGAPAEVEEVRLRAHPVPVVYTVKVEQEDGASISKYGRRSPDVEPTWASEWDLLSLAQLILANRAERLPTIKVRFSSGTKAILREQLSRDVSDRVHVVYPAVPLDDDFYVEAIRHVVTGRGEDRRHETIFSCEKVATSIPAGLAPFIVGSSTLNGGNVIVGTGDLSADDLLVLDVTPIGEGVLAY